MRNELRATSIQIEVLWKPYPLKRVFQVDAKFRPAGMEMYFVRRIERTYLDEEYVPHVTQVFLEILAKKEGE